MLCDFANHYGTPPQLIPYTPLSTALSSHTTAATSTLRPSSAEVAEMAQRATLVLQLVEHLRRIASASASGTGLPSSSAAAAAATAAASSAAAVSSLAGAMTSPSGDRLVYHAERERERESDDSKDKVKGGGSNSISGGSRKRPWEDAVGGATGVEEGERSIEDVCVVPPSPYLHPSFFLFCVVSCMWILTSVHQHPTTHTASFDPKAISSLRSVAEKDMEIIRSKRAQQAVGAGGGGGTGSGAQGAVKPKYRKRSVSRVFDFALFQVLTGMRAVCVFGGYPDSVRRRLASAIRVIYGKRLSGGGGLMVRGHCVTLVVYVRHFFHVPVIPFTLYPFLSFTLHGFLIVFRFGHAVHV